MKLGIIITVSFLLAGCASLFPIQVTDPRTGIEYTVPARLQDVPGIKELAEACATKAGRVVHRTVEVEGYFDESLDKCEQGCWYTLLMSGFQFVELDVTEVESWEVIQREGTWRVYKEDSASNLCNQKISATIGRLAIHNPVPANTCLALQQVASPISQYQYSSWIEKRELNDEFGSYLVIGIDDVSEIKSAEVVAQQVTIDLYAKYGKNTPARQLSCKSVGISKPARNFKRTVIKPK